MKFDSWAYTLPLATELSCKQHRQERLATSYFLSHLRKDANSDFLAYLRLGKQRIPTRASVKSERSSSPEGTRSFSEALLYGRSELGITEIWICERSELGGIVFISVFKSFPQSMCVQLQD